MKKANGNKSPRGGPIHFLVLLSFVIDIILPVNLPAHVLSGLDQWEEQEEAIILSEKVGAIIEEEERNTYGLFPTVADFVSAVILPQEDGSFQAKVTYQHQGMEKTSLIQLSMARVKEMSVLIDHFEEIQRIKVPRWLNEPLTINFRDGSSRVVHYYWFTDKYLLVRSGQTKRAIPLENISSFQVEQRFAQMTSSVALMLLGVFFGFVFRAHYHHD